MSDFPDRPNFTAGLRILARLCRPALRPMMASTALAVASSVLELVPFVVFFLAIKDLLDGTADGGWLILAAGIVAVASAVRFATWSLALKISHLAAFDVMADLRLAIAQRLAQLPLGWFSRRRSGKVQRALTEDVQRLEVLLAHAIPELVSALVFWFAAAIWLIAADWALAIATLGVAPLAFFVLWLGMHDSSIHVRRITAAADDLHGRAAEVFRHPPVVRLFDRFGAITGPIEEAIDEAVAADEAWSRRYAGTGTGFRVLITADFVVALPVGVWLLTRGLTDAVSLVLVLLLGAGILQPLERAYRLGFRLSWISYAGATVDAMLQETALPEPLYPQRPRSGPVEFANVTFAHEPQSPTVSDVTFRAEVGEVTALVGPSGAGKSTLTRLLARFWDIDDGSIRIGGVDVRNLESSDLFAQLALVFQDPFLFSDTIAENLRVGRVDATDDELIAACRAARLHDTIVSLPAGYQTLIGAGGVDLSGGERQRLTIARAMLRNAPIVVLDEATAMADPDNEAAIQDAISELVAGRTLIVIAHRLRTIASADRIVVIDRGRVVETGRHGELLEAGGTYATMWNDMLMAESMHLGNSVNGVSVGGGS